MSNNVVYKYMNKFKVFSDFCTRFRRLDKNKNNNIHNNRSTKTTQLEKWINKKPTKHDLQTDVSSKLLLDAHLHMESSLKNMSFILNISREIRVSLIPLLSDEQGEIGYFKEFRIITKLCYENAVPRSLIYLKHHRR